MDTSQRSAVYAPVYVGQPELRSHGTSLARIVDGVRVERYELVYSICRSAFGRRSAACKRGKRSNRPRKRSEHPGYFDPKNRVSSRRGSALLRSPGDADIVLLHAPHIHVRTFGNVFTSFFVRLGPGFCVRPTVPHVHGRGAPCARKPNPGVRHVSICSNQHRTRSDPRGILSSTQGRWIF